MDNALKYNRPGGELCLALRSAGDAAEFRITNTGEGIAPELLPRVFDRFVRGNHGADENMQGSGVGLTICQWIVHGHGGTIRIGSEPGRLTTVTVLLPLATQ
ncbi:MAG: ATP-binding protein [Verrucomicrobia bacterium]|nr:ATP-binding protein [Verrucomicrobiota bacterium]